MKLLPNKGRLPSFLGLAAASSHPRDGHCVSKEFREGVCQFLPMPESWENLQSSQAVLLVFTGMRGEGEEERERTQRHSPLRVLVG